MRWMPHSVRRSRMKSLTSLAMSILSREEGGRDGAEAGDCRDRPAAPVELEEQAPRLRLVVEGPVRADVAEHGLEKISLALAVERLLGLLGVVAEAREVAIEEAGRDLLAVDRLDRRPADDELAPLVLGRVVDRLGCDLGLEDRRHRLRLARHLGAAP